MNIEQYINQCEENLIFLENQETYEVCQEFKLFIEILKTRDVEAFIASEFDIDGLIEIGFLKIKNPTTQEIEDRIKSYFNLEDIFEYAFMHAESGVITTIARDLLTIAKTQKLTNNNCKIIN